MLSLEAVLPMAAVPPEVLLATAAPLDALLAAMAVPLVAMVAHLGEAMAALQVEVGPPAEEDSLAVMALLEDMAAHQTAMEATWALRVEVVEHLLEVVPRVEVCSMLLV
jgi:hypothetical protein